MSAPTATPNLLGMRFAHRMMLRDLHRLAATAQKIAGGDACDARRATAIATWVRHLCHEIHHHHTVEDELTWPLIERSAGSEVDLAVLSEDHAALDPLLDEIRWSVDAFEGRPGIATAERLAAALGRVRDELEEHIGEEERAVFPVIERYVSVKDWEAMEKEIRKGGAPLTFVLPRFEGVVRPEEKEEVRKLGGPVMALLMALVRPGYQRRERLVFG
jgi:hemerythrin-like domain-containing protein